MPVTLKPDAVEKSTYPLQFTFRDQAGTLSVPDANTIKWTLTDRLGNVINNRSQVAVSSASTITIVLSGDDLKINGDDRLRLLLIEYTFTSSLGVNLPWRDEYQFTIQNLVKVT